MVGAHFILFLLACLGASSPLWVPIAFVAYAIGKRKYSTGALVLLITIECIALAVLAALIPMMQVARE